MADIGKAIVTYLKAQSGVSDLVGQRVYRGAARQGATLPHIVVTIDDESKHHGIAAATGVSEAAIEVDCFGSTRRGTGGANIVGAAVDTALDRLNDTTSTSVLIHHVFSTFRLEDYERPIAGESAGRFVDRREYQANFDD